MAGRANGGEDRQAWQGGDIKAAIAVEGAVKTMAWVAFLLGQSIWLQLVLKLTAWYSKTLV